MEKNMKSKSAIQAKRWREALREAGKLEQYEKDRYQKRKESVKQYNRDHREKIQEQANVRRATIKGIIKYLLIRARKRAREGGLLFDLTENDIIIPDICPVLKIPLFQGNGKSIDNSPSLDRLNNDLGYLKGNVMVVSHKANRLKSNGTIKEFRLLLEFLEGLPCHPSIS